MLATCAQLPYTQATHVYLNAYSFYVCIPKRNDDLCAKEEAHVKIFITDYFSPL